jgi:hypothetical protein
METVVLAYVPGPGVSSPSSRSTLSAIVNRPGEAAAVRGYVTLRGRGMFTLCTVLGHRVARYRPGAGESSDEVSCLRVGGGGGHSTLLQWGSG